MSPRTRLVLASASPRRRELLDGAGISFEVRSADIDETPQSGEAPQQLVERLSRQKASVVAALDPSAWVLGADTDVVLDGEVFGKPRDHAEACAMLSKLQGRTHEVWGAFTILGPGRSKEMTVSTRTAVRMAALTPSEIAAYVDTGEPMDKAGAYAIQDIGAHLISSIEGSYTNVVGLDLAAAIRGLVDLGAVAYREPR